LRCKAGFDTCLDTGLDTSFEGGVFSLHEMHSAKRAANEYKPSCGSWKSTRSFIRDGGPGYFGVNFFRMKN